MFSLLYIPKPFNVSPHFNNSFNLGLFKCIYIQVPFTHLNIILVFMARLSLVQFEDFAFFM